MSNPKSPFAGRPLSAWLQVLSTGSDAEERYRALQAVIALGREDEVVGLIRQGLDDADSAVRAGAARWLARSAEKSSRPGAPDDWKSIQSVWEKLLKDDDPDVRFESARGLLALTPDHAAALAVVLEFLRDPETQPVMQVSILKTLSQAGMRLSADSAPWLPLLQAGQAEVRETAARTVGHCGVAAAGEFSSALIALLNDEEPFVREEAARALGNSPTAPEEMLTALEAAANDEDTLVAEAAQASLTALRSR